MKKMSYFEQGRTFLGQFGGEATGSLLSMLTGLPVLPMLLGGSIGGNLGYRWARSKWPHEETE